MQIWKASKASPYLYMVCTYMVMSISFNRAEILMGALWHSANTFIKTSPQQRSKIVASVHHTNCENNTKLLKGLRRYDSISFQRPAGCFLRWLGAKSFLLVVLKAAYGQRMIIRAKQINRGLNLPKYVFQIQWQPTTQEEGMQGYAESELERWYESWTETFVV